MTFQEKLSSNYYNTNPYPWVSAGSAKNDPEKAAQRQQYVDFGKQLDAEFKADALEEVGLTGHPKAEAAFKLAMEYADGYGSSEAFNYLVDLAELLK